MNDTEYMAKVYKENQMEQQLLSREPDGISEINRNILLVFYHVPKTAGSSFNLHLARIYGRFMVKYHPRFNPDLLSNHPPVEEILVLSSHIPRVHRLLGQPDGVMDPRPAPDNGLFTGRDIRQVSLVRDPIDRLVSYYNFVTSFPLHKYYTAAHEMTAFDFFTWMQTNKDPELQDLQCRLLTGRSDATFEDAARIVREEFFLVAPTRSFLPMVEMLAAELNWPAVETPEVANVSPKKTRRTDLDEATLELLHRNNANDLRLYHYVVTLFEDRRRRWEADQDLM